MGFHASCAPFKEYYTLGQTKEPGRITRMSKDLERCKAEDAEEWRKQNGPWHAHEIKEWMGREVECLPHLQAYLRVLDSLQANSVPHNGAPPTGGVGWPTLLLLRLVVLSTCMDPCLRPCWVQIAMVVVLPKAV